MIVILCGASASGKSILEQKLKEDAGFQKIISCTTRDMRENESNGRDYHFMSKTKFEQLIDNHDFAEFTLYSKGRYYGTLVEDIIKAAESTQNYVMVLTPSGMRAIQNLISKDGLLTVYIDAPLKDRVIRYIERCGKDFGFEDFDEIHSRVNRDFGMFAGIEKEVDLVYENKGKDLSTISNIMQDILEKLNEKEHEVNLER